MSTVEERREKRKSKKKKIRDYRQWVKNFIPNKLDFFSKKKSGGEDIFSEKKGGVDLFLKRKRAENFLHYKI